VQPIAILRPLLPDHPQQFLERKVPLVLLWVMALVAAWQLGALSWRFAYPAATSTALQVPTGGPTAPSTSLTDAAAVAALHLFGTSERSAGPAMATQAPTDLPETQLRLTLNGVMAADPQSASRAFIRVGTAAVAVFAVGDEVTTGAALDGVYLDRVVLRRAGRLETLRFPASEAPQVVTPRAAATVANDGPLAAIRRGLDGDPQQLLNIIRPSPYYQNGEQLGYRVVPGQDRAAFSELGLNIGDVITHIDGQALTDPGTSMVALQRLAQTGQAQLTVRRDGRDLTLSLPIQ
jgi:general secretion pathway protein C